MKIQVRVNSKVFIEATGDTQTAIFEQAASLQEVFGAFDKCGKCDCEDLRFVVREDKEKNKYYELHCQAHQCRARLSFGQNKGDKLGAMYPRRQETKKQSVMGGKLQAGDWLPDDGWIRWNKGKQESE
jgi:hypothetical protein